MERLWEKGEMVVVQGQRGTAAAAAHCVLVGICLYPSRSLRKDGLQRLGSSISSP